MDVRRGSNAVETYLNHLVNLQKIRDKIPGLPRAADADMALWVLQGKMLHSSAEDLSINLESEQEQFMLRP